MCDRETLRGNRSSTHPRPPYPSDPGEDTWPEVHGPAEACRPGSERAFAAASRVGGRCGATVFGEGLQEGAAVVTGAVPAAPRIFTT